MIEQRLNSFQQAVQRYQLLPAAKLLPVQYSLVSSLQATILHITTIGKTKYNSLQLFHPSKLQHCTKLSS